MITIERDTLRAALKVCRSPERPHHPDYGLITIKPAPASMVYFEAADDDWQVRLRVPAAAPSYEGSLSLDAIDLIYVAGGMGKLMTITRRGEEAEISAAPLTARLRTHAAPGEHTPIMILSKPLVFDHQTAKARMQADTLAAGLELVVEAASHEPARYYIGGVYMQRLSAAQVGLTATNGHLLTHAPLDAHHVAHDWRGSIIPRWCVDRLVAFLRRLPEGQELNIYETGNGLRFEDSNRTATMDIRAIDAGFPDWQRVVPPEQDRWTFKIDAPQFQAACRRLLRGRRRAKAHVLSWGGLIELDQRELTIHAPLRTGRDRSVSLVYAGCPLLHGPRRIIRGVNLNYLRLLCEMLAGASTVRVCSPSDGTGMAFRADSGAVVVLMPMRPNLDEFNLEGTWE